MALAKHYLRNFRRASIDEDTITNFSRGMQHAGTIIQVVNGTVYMDPKWHVHRAKNSYYARVLGVAELLKRALAKARRDRAFTIPDTEMLVWGTDGPYSQLRCNGTVPIVTITGLATRPCGIPVPMPARDWSGDGFHKLGTAAWNKSSLARMVRGPTHNVAVAGASWKWEQKRDAALFRGNFGPGSLHGSEHRCESEFLSAKLTLDGQMEPGPCFRLALVRRLQRLKHFDVAISHMPEDEWPRYKLLLIIGNVLGWADRFMASLFKDSVSVLVDAGTYEWYYPLLVEGVHYLRANTTVASLQGKVEWALQQGPVRLSTIAQAGGRYALELLEFEQVLAYTTFIARAYSEKLSYTPHLRAGFSVFTSAQRWTDNMEIV